MSQSLSSSHFHSLSQMSTHIYSPPSSQKMPPKSKPGEKLLPPPTLPPSSTPTSVSTTTNITESPLLPPEPPKPELYEISDLVTADTQTTERLNENSIFNNPLRIAKLLADRVPSTKSQKRKREESPEAESVVREAVASGGMAGCIGAVIAGMSCTYVPFLSSPPFFSCLSPSPHSPSFREPDLPTKLSTKQKMSGDMS